MRYITKNSAHGAKAATTTTAQQQKPRPDRGRGDVDRHQLSGSNSLFEIIGCFFIILFDSNFDKAYIKYMDERTYGNKDKNNIYRKNTVKYKLTSSVNIYKMYDKQKIKNMLRELLLVIYEYKV